APSCLSGRTEPNRQGAGPPPNRPLSVRTFGLTNRGRVRASNEDQFFIAELTKSMKVLHASLPQPKTQRSDERGYLFILVAGIGESQGGGQAKRQRGVS